MKRAYVWSCIFSASEPVLLNFLLKNFRISSANTTIKASEIRNAQSLRLSGAVVNTCCIIGTYTISAKIPICEAMPKIIHLFVFMLVLKIDCLLVLHAKTLPACATTMPAKVIVTPLA